MYFIICLQQFGHSPYLAFDEEGKEPFLSNNKVRALDHLEELRRNNPQWEYSLYSKEDL